MIQKRLKQFFSAIRVYTNTFTVTNDSYTLSADLLPLSTFVAEN